MELKRLDIGCGGNRQEGFVGIDKRALPGVDIVHDLEVFPWPLLDETFATVVASHFVEHLKPWLSIDFMDECWRILAVTGEMAISTPYPGSRGYWQDPTHCNGWSEVTWQYFDPNFPLFGIYKPKPWKIRKGFPVYQVNGNLEVILTKMSLEELENRVPETLGICVAEGIVTEEKIGG